MHVSPFLPQKKPEARSLLPSTSNVGTSHAPWQQLCSKLSRSEKRCGFVWIRHLSFKGQGSRAPVLEKLTDQFCLTPELWISITTLCRLWGVKGPLSKTITKSAVQCKGWRGRNMLTEQLQQAIAWPAELQSPCFCSVPAMCFLTFSPKVRFNSDLESLFP